MTRRRWEPEPRPWPAGLALLLVLVAVQAGPAWATPPPEVVTVRVPSSKTSLWFPAGTELTVLAPDRFDELVRAARAGALRREDSATPRLLRARHAARWDGGMLVGHSELVVTRRSAEVAIEPWTPAIVATAGHSAPIRCSDDGRAWVRTDEGDPREPTATIAVDWQLRSRPGSRGGRFQLGLPGTEVSELDLDLPTGWEPAGAPGLRSGPIASTKGRATWKLLDRGGLLDLRIVRPDSRGDSLEGAGLWCGGPTRVDVNEATATWTLEWTVTGPAWTSRTLTFDLDAGLELVDVTGPAVEEFRPEPVPAAASSGPGGTRVSVRLRSVAPAATAVTVGVASTPPGTSVTVRAIAAVPSEGRWIVPAARPVDAVWTGGTTTVKLGPSRVVRNVRNLAGRRIPARGSGPGDDRAFVFEAEQPAAVAELDLHKPEAEVSTEVRGQLTVGHASPRLDVRIAWQVHRGRLHDLDFDLPRTWTADRVEVEGLAGPVTWHSDMLPSGGVRIRVPFPTGDWSTRPVALRVSATAEVAGGRGPLALPRVRPVAGRSADEVWVGLSEPGITLQPKEVRGLAWIDPEVVPALTAPATATPAPGAASTGPPTEPNRPALAWRWLADDAEARVERDRTEPAPLATVETTVIAAPDRLRVQSRLEVTARDQPWRSLAVGLSGGEANASGWRFFEEGSGLELPRKSLDARQRADAELPGSGPAWQIDLAGPQRGKIALTARFEGAWNGNGPLPLLVLPRSLRWRGVVLVMTRRHVLSAVETRAVHTLDPEITAESLAAESPASPSAEPARSSGVSELRGAHAFAYETVEAHVELRLGNLTAGASDGVIREAFLSSAITPGLPARHRLTLRITPERAPSLSLVLPTGMSLERVLRDGAAVVPTRAGDAIVVPLISGNASPAARGQVTVELDYLGPGVSSSGSATVRLQRPGLSLPCLGLAWELVVPQSWRVCGWGPALTPIDPKLDDASPTDGWLGWFLPLRRWLSRSPSGDANARAQALRDLDARVAAARGEELSLGEWFLRWDAGAWPIVIDRAALAAIGWGPRSRVAPPRSAPGTTGAALAWLEPLGLAPVPLGQVVLVTTREQAQALSDDQLRRDGSAASWTSALREAAAWGSDRSDRFQSAARWREEATPRAPAGDDAQPGAALGGRRVRRFAATGWPDTGVRVDLVDVHASAAWIRIIALGILLLGLFAAGRPPVVRAVAIVGLLGLSLTALSAAPAWIHGPAVGLVWGTAGVACLGLGFVLPGPRSRPQQESRTSTFPRPGAPPGRTTPVFLALALAGMAAPLAIAEDTADSPILALLPYEGTPDPSRPSDRVVLRLSDFQRLRALAEEPFPAATGSLYATAAVHSVSWRDRETVAITTDLTLQSTAGASGSLPWSFPVEEAREIAATLDGTAVPVRVAEGGKQATVNVDVATPKQGSRHLVIRRVVTATAGDQGVAAVLAVNAVATATVEVAAHPDRLAVEIPAARGMLEPAGEPGTLKGRLGPVSRLEIHWSGPAAPDAPRPSGSVEALELWDVTPAGDRLRTRFTYRAATGTSVIRIGLDPGVIVRETIVPESADITREGTSEHPEWVARFDPPLPDGATIGLDVWRPRAAEESAAARSLERAQPGVEPLGIERFSGTLAFRRPPDWVGRITAPAGSEASEEAFARAWKVLPDEPLTLSGAVRLTTIPVRGSSFKVSTGPLRSLFRVRSDARVDVGAGRVGISVEATLSETEGPTYEAVVVCPAEFRPLSVSSEGLTDWSQVDARTLRLRLDGPPARVRKVAITGWMPGPAGEKTVAGTTQEIDVPWLHWPDQVEEPGTLTLTGATQAVLAGAEESDMIRPEPAKPTPGTPMPRTAYRVNRPTTPGRLRWDQKPPRVGVFVESQLTLDPDAAEWLAVLRYDVAGGPLDALHLKVPAAWARDVTVRLSGTTYQLATETRGDYAILSIRPDRPVWGSQRLVLRASTPFGAGETLVFPDISPLGQGEVDTYLRVVNATRIVPSVAGQPGLQPVAATSVPPDEELTEATLRAATSSSYHVIRPGWSLRVSRPGSPTRDAQGAEHPRVSNARVFCTLTDSGELMGQARFDVAPHGGPFLDFALAAGARPLWASVNGAQAVPLRAPNDRWQVALADEGPSRVVLVWRAEPPPADEAARPRPLSLPQVGTGTVPAVVVIHTQGSGSLQSRSQQLRPATIDRVFLAEAKWLESQAIESLDGFDRAARKSGEDLVAALVRLDLRLRQAERAASWDPEILPTERGTHLSIVRTVAQRLRGELGDVLRNAALDEFEASARLWLGTTSEAPETPVLPTPEAANGLRIRPIGQPHAFTGELPETSEPSPLIWTPTPAGAFPWFSVLALASVAATAAAFLLARRLAGSRWLGRAALAAVLAILALVAGPLGLLSGVGLTVLGRLAATRTVGPMHVLRNE